MKRQHLPHRRVVLGASVAALMAALGVTGFLVLRSFDNGSEAQADQPGAAPAGNTSQASPSPSSPGKTPGKGLADTNPPGPDVTPLPGATPDTSQPWWYVPYLNQDAAKPKFEGLVNGIAISTSPVELDTPCPAPVYGALEVVAGTHLAIAPAYLPPGAVVGPTSGGPVVVCEGTAVSSEAAFSVPSDPKAGVLGGDIRVYRYVSATPRAQALAPADRWIPGTVAGVPAAIAQPILPDLGVGNSAIVFYSGGVVTRVTASGIPLDEIQKVAEGLLN